MTEFLTNIVSNTAPFLVYAIVAIVIYKTGFYLFGLIK